ncbi:pyrroline-5-carboxylate reductase [Novosphingobium fuchskuhlense]|uniref:Pyrroline-5-carboxylate reductase n=1 Tax=Novosphingobium fuchskuhlense TaxID=1117702 RepID=A0A117USX2_9SPHN|nr:pyrroline-5-carboxylate reductase [Novosphingobium fuchskuhlense]
MGNHRTLQARPTVTFSLLQFGCGNMGGAMLAGWLAGGFDPAAFTVVDPLLAEAPAGVRLLREPPAGAAPADVVLLGFKPQQFAASAAAIAPHVGEGTLLLSILAGVDCTTLRAAFPAAAAVVRVMPNLAAAIGKSPIALFGDAAGPARERTEALMAPLGPAEWLAEEGAMDIVTALAGSGPAFVYRVIDALAEGAAALGLPRSQADRLALAMIEGASALAAASPHAPGELARRVASPGGTTEAGLKVLDADERLAALLTATLRAARDRSAELTEAARS